jgi:hypothetical protein
MSEVTEQLPLDWDEWRGQWQQWRLAHATDLRSTDRHFPGKNFLANEKLGTWKIKGRVVELSEVTFPNLTERDERGRLKIHDVRAIGITYGVGVDSAGTVVHSFAELERELGLS